MALGIEFVNLPGETPAQTAAGDDVYVRPTYSNTLTSGSRKLYPTNDDGKRLFGNFKNYLKQACAKYGSVMESGSPTLYISSPEAISLHRLLQKALPAPAPSQAGAVTAFKTSAAAYSNINYTNAHTLVDTLGKNLVGVTNYLKAVATSEPIVSHLYNDTTLPVGPQLQLDPKKSTPGPRDVVIGPTSADSEGDTTSPPPPPPPPPKKTPWLALGAGAAVIAVVGGATFVLTRKKKGVSGLGRARARKRRR